MIETNCKTKLINMKNILLFLTLIVFSLAACKKNTFRVTDRTSPDGKALVKIAYFSATNTLPNVQLYLNGIRQTPPIAYPYPYPGGGQNTNGSNNADFLQADPGSNKFEVFVPNTGTSVPSSKLFESTQTFEANKKQILFVVDTGTTMSGFTVITETPTPDSGFSRVNFVNGIPNAPSVDFYKGTNATSATVIATDIRYKEHSDYFNIPFGTDSFFVRPAGSPTATPIARRAFTFANQRIYTILSAGYNGATGNRAARLSAIVTQ
jgi:hypothetical protein